MKNSGIGETAHQGKLVKEPIENNPFSSLEWKVRKLFDLPLV